MSGVSSPLAVIHLELCAGEGLLGDAVVLLDDQTALAGVFDHHGLSVSALPDDHVGGGRVDDVPAIRGLDFVDHIGTGSQIGDLDLTLSVGGEDAVLGQGIWPPLTEFFDEVRQRCRFKYWFFGHYHEDMIVEKKYVMLYEQIIRLKP